MTVHQCSTSEQHRHCKRCAVPVGKGKSYCPDCFKEKRKDRNRMEAQERRALANSLKPPKPESIICKNCGKERNLAGYRGVIPTFCSAKCNIEFWKKDNDYKYPPSGYSTVYFRDCKNCGTSFVGRHGLTWWCSDDCRTLVQSGINKERGKNQYQQRKDEGLKKRIEFHKLKPPKICSVCGVSFSVLYGAMVKSFCSDECVKVKKNEIKKSSASRAACRARRRTRLRKTKIENFKPVEIFQRDKWRCGLCGKKVNKALRHPHQKSASLDHIVPLAEGGEHSRSNVQLAHLDCNWQKGTQSKGEQLWLIG